MAVTKKAIHFLRPNGFMIMKVSRTIVVPAHTLNSRQDSNRS
jgi:hypothetical protein